MLDRLNDCLFSLFLIGLGMLLFAPGETGANDPPQQDGWLGIYSTAVESLPVIEEEAGGAEALRGATTGLRVDAVFPHSPAEAGGLMEGDIIVGMGGELFTCPKDSVRAIFQRGSKGMVGDPRPMRVIRNAVARRVRVDGELLDPLAADRFWLDARGFSDSLTSGGSIEARANRKQEVLDLDVVLGPRPEAKWPAAAESQLPPGAKESDFAPLAWELIDQAGVRDDCEDLLGRLSALHKHSDPLRHKAVILAHRYPFMLESLMSWGVFGTRDTSSFREPFSKSYYPFPEYSEYHEDSIVQAHAGIDQWRKLVHSTEESCKRFYGDRYREWLVEIPAQEKLNTLLTWIELCLEEIALTHDSTFIAWTPEEREFVENNMWGLSDAFKGEVYIHFDEDRNRFEKNRMLIELAGRVDYQLMHRQWKRVLDLSDPIFPYRSVIYDLFADSLQKEYLIDHETPYGRIVVGGTGANWHKDRDIALLIDLGGDDFYTGNAGASRGFDLPASICIDLSGDDAYESTERGAQGSGILGIGQLIDLEGNDTYIGKEWCQGTGFYGIGSIKDVTGNDTYRGRTFCQGVGLFGRGYIWEQHGDDRYEGDCKVQGVGLAGGIGAIYETQGNDQYYAKGLNPTGYGTSGIFDSWSQGCGMGFRTLASGGIGLIEDLEGEDRMEAGNFSQGGGYYYGMGIVTAGGAQNDIYIGSRYNQGFSAHQAVGVFLDEGGDDYYTTRHGVAQGLAWDECVTLFIDKQGDDIYEGGRFFSQGASAHNSICFFVDRGGSDEYRYAPGPARSGANNYHGGTSLSLFLEIGFKEDLYTSETARNQSVQYKPEHGFFVDLFGGIGKATDEEIWKDLESSE